MRVMDNISMLTELTKVAMNQLSLAGIGRHPVAVPSPWRGKHPMAALSPWRRDLSMLKGVSYSGYGRYLRPLQATLTATQPPSSDHTNHFYVEKLWEEFFSDPSQWSDHRSEKGNMRYPDFKHKKTHKCLWLNSKLKPPWVDERLALMAPGTIQSSIFPWNKRLTAMVVSGKLEMALKLFQQMQLEGTNPDTFSFVEVLKACAGLKALEEGRRIHMLIIKCGCESDLHVGRGLIDMYVKCGSIEDAEKIFEEKVTPNLLCWNAMILGYVKCGQDKKALELFQQMTVKGVEPVPATFVAVLNACANLTALEDGQHIHEQIIQRGCETQLYVGSTLVDMYAKCGVIEDAKRVFNKMLTHNVVSWNVMILGLVKCGLVEEAFELFEKMQTEGMEPNFVTFVGMLNACASLGALEKGRNIHEQIIQGGCESHIYVGTSLVDMYAKCGSIDEACRVFNKMPTCNVVAWNALIQGHVICGQAQKALDLFQQMEHDGIEPDSGTFTGVLRACASLKTVEEGRRIHDLIIRRGSETDIFVGSSLIDMYAKCRRMDDAWRVFSKMPAHNVVSWSSLIQGYVKAGESLKALELWKQMQGDGVEPDAITFVALLNACACMESFDQGRLVHEQIIRSGCQLDVYVGSSLVDMYTKCGSIEDAWEVFNVLPTRNVVTWSAMILGLVKYGQGQSALELYKQMECERVEADPITFVAVLNACGSLEALEEGKRVHGHIIQRGVSVDLYVGNSLVDMYVKCGSIEDAAMVFNEISRQDVVSWNAMIRGFVKCGQNQKALELSLQMHREGVKPNPSTFVGLINACANLTAIEEGRLLHEQIRDAGCEANFYVGTSLVDMYVKCGSPQEAWRVFDKMPIRNAVSWNAMLGGNAS